MPTKKASSKKSSTKSSSAKKSSAKKSPAKKSSAKSSSKKSSSKKSATSKRTMIEPHAGDKRFVRRDKEGQFKKEVSVSRSLSSDSRSDSKTVVKSGQGDRGDRKPAKKK
jgi:hypothetical protein